MKFILPTSFISMYVFIFCFLFFVLFFSAVYIFSFVRAVAVCYSLYCVFVYMNEFVEEQPSLAVKRKCLRYDGGVKLTNKINETITLSVLYCEIIVRLTYTHVLETSGLYVHVPFASVWIGVVMKGHNHVYV